MDREVWRAADHGVAKSWRGKGGEREERGKGRKRRKKKGLRENERLNDMHGSPGWYLTCRC